MDAFELLKGWPGWANANAEKVLSSPAWRMNAEFDGIPATVVRAAEPLADALWVEIALDDEPHALGLGAATDFHDLDRLWARRADLPREVLLALVERECGKVFQTVENVFRRRLEVRGIAAAGDGATAFEIRTEVGVHAFALDLTPSLLQTLGQLRNLDTDHPSVRAMSRPAEVEYAAPTLAEEEVAALAPGDCLVIEDAAAVWRVAGDAAPDAIRIVDAAAGELTFEQLVEGSRPPLPEAAAPVLVRGAAALAELEFCRVGVARAARVRSVSNEQEG